MLKLNATSKTSFELTTNDFKDHSTSAYGECQYDANGMTSILSKGIAWIKYNSLNLPSKIQFMNGNKTEYLYDASGVKRESKYSYAVTTMQIPWGQTSIENTGSNLCLKSKTDYCGSYIYENDTIKRILTSEGYIQTEGTKPANNISNWKYTYFLKDHLGNTRAQLISAPLSNSRSTTYTVAGLTDYYPFGMEISTPEGLLTSGKNPYLYNGKEMDRMNGLNEYDYGARWYDAAVGRWGVVDPLCEKYYSISPYAYCAGNPVNLIDPDGMDWYQYTGEDGKKAIIWQEGNAKSIELNGQSYNNIGETYTTQVDKNTSITYTQNEVTSITTNTMNESDWVSQYSKPMWGTTPADKACNKACDAMLANEGTKSSGMEVVVNNAGNGRAGIANNKASNAIDNMSAAIDLGKPTKVNIDRKPGSSSADGMGDHFIVVQGKTETVNNGQVSSTVFNYFDPGTRYISKGTSPNNTLTIMNRTLVGTHNKQQIVVTSIRPSK